MIKIVSYESGWAACRALRVKPFEVVEATESQVAELLRSYRRVLALEDFREYALRIWPHNVVRNMARRRGIEGAREATEESVRAALAAVDLPLDEAQALIVIPTPEPVVATEQPQPVEVEPEREAPTPAQVGLIGDGEALDYEAQLAAALDADAYAAVRTLVAEREHAPQPKAELYAVASRILGREEG